MPKKFKKSKKSKKSKKLLISELNLELESTLQELPLWEVQIELDCPGNELTILFEQDPLLPGIILTKNQDFVGMISRQKFFEHMISPYSLALYSMRPIETLYKNLQSEICVLAEDMLIVEATQLALQRSPQLFYEPILVECKTKPRRYRLVDFHELLLAYSQIYVLTLTQLQNVQEQSRIASAGFRDLQHNYARLVQNEKMAALGQLVAGIAHEINNPVNFIAGNIVHAINYSQNLIDLNGMYKKHYPHPVTEIQKFTDQIELEFLIGDFANLLSSMKMGCDRIQQIILSLRNFSRLDEAEKKAVDIHEGIDSTLLILQSRLKTHQKGKKSITILKQYQPLPLVECYAGLLNQVFMNIMANAIDALSECSEFSVLNCESASLTPNSPAICIHTQLSDDNQVIIRIVDNGPGIPESVQKNLFDPFFTTKPVGKGTGLGLSISHQIVVEKHGGDLHCISAPGQGTEFIIKIPQTA
ncbi:ATP-binding protein [Cylindrospermum sp. FACHB-282]|uniref:ATP-binding protein n=1 Tax=Cylindrospermum sp. FACHB-282 TaxID=2692794 RepID=UPI002816081B|nr:ATP-binding protein [Cylindrospermum sp. FACHB-282]